MIEALVVIYFGVGVILVTFGPARYSIAREVEKVKNLKPSSRSNSKAVGKNKIILFRFVITAGFVVLWPFFLPGVLKDNQKSATFALVNKIKKALKVKNLTAQNVIGKKLFRFCMAIHHQKYFKLGITKK